MNSRLLFQVLALTLAMSLPQLGIAQIDVTQVTADTKTYLFSDGKTSVKTYIVEQLQKQSTCCGDEKLYLEVRIDPSGYVKEVKALTGKGECFKKSAIDIVKNIKWNNAGMTGPKTVYFEITPNIGCEGRANTYAAIAITNNPLLAGAVASLPAATPATTPEQPAVTQPAAQPTQPAAQPVAAQLEKPAVATTQPATQPVAQPTTQPAVTTPQPAATQQVAPAATASAGKTQPQPQTQPSFTAPMPPQNQPGKTTTPAASSSQTPEQRMAEIQQLQRQLNEMKAAEDARNQVIAENARLKKEAEERKRKEEEEKKKKEEADRAAAAAAMAARNTPAPTTPAQGKPGTTPAGKPKQPTLDELYGRTDREPNYDIVEEEAPATRPGQQGSKPGKPGAAHAPGDSSKVVVDPNQEKLLVAQRKLVELEARNQANALQVEKFEKERAAIMAEMQKAQQAILTAKEEEARKKEQAELDAIAATKKEAEAKQVESQAAIERIQKEMQLLQEEIQKRMADIERFKQEADAAEQLRIQKEQEFLVANAQRNADIFAAGTPGALAPMLPVPLPTDTSKVGLLIYQVNVLTQQVAALQNMIMRMQNGGGSYQATGNGTRTIQPAPTRPGQNTPGTTGRVISSPAARTAADDKSWRNVDMAVAKTPEDGKANREAIEAGIRENLILTGAAAQQPATPQGTTPRVNVVQTPSNQAHDDIHVNTAGPTLSRPEYEDGEQGMKDYIRGQLRLNGVCGLAQAAFEVTVNPRGEVISYRVLAANTPQVISLMPNILTSLKFKQSNSRYNQNSYLEFKTEIRCDDKPSTGELERTPNYIEAPATNR